MLAEENHSLFTKKLLDDNRRAIILEAYLVHDETAYYGFFDS
jgi:hypothetical protein